METEIPVHRPTRLPEGTLERWRIQVELYRRSIELFHLAISGRGRARGTFPRPVTRAAAVAPAVGPAAPLVPPSPEADWGPLTPRERDIAALIARGLSNRGIARELVLTEGTAANHVRRILLRLSFDSRAQVAAWVAGDERRRAYAPAPPPPRTRRPGVRSHQRSPRPRV
ncbi:MAG TPA: LuxR C-terminal-related transcriptional regulator [Chloroflexota bacterium]